MTYACWMRLFTFDSLGHLKTAGEWTAVAWGSEAWCTSRGLAVSNWGSNASLLVLPVNKKPWRTAKRKKEQG